MIAENTKIETVADYRDSSPTTVQWCKTNLLRAKNNPALGGRYTKRLREVLLEGIKIKDSTGIEIIRRFDYPTAYIANVMKAGHRTWNKYVIMAALEYNESYDLDEVDPRDAKVSLRLQEQLNKGYSKKKRRMVKNKRVRK